mgnify:FL=1
MHISHLSFKGIRGYSTETSFELSPTTNYFVGENNSGKSSILDAIHYLRNDTRTPEDTFTIGLDESYVEATLSFAPDEAEAPLGDDYAKLENFFSHNGDRDTIRIRRQSYDDNVISSQTGKKSKITTKNILIQNPETNKFENPTGIAALVQRLFDTCFIYADEQVADHADMAKTKTLGKLISAQLSAIEEGAPWQQYIASHTALFESKGAGTVQEQLQTTAERVSTLMREQYGETTVTFAFTPPEAQALLKSGQVIISEPQETIAEMPLENKGTGMQRAFMLALLQVVAETSTNGHSATIYGLDEPETWLHPRAQIQLSKALSQLSANGRQILICSHSPYMLKNIDGTQDRVFIVERTQCTHRITLEEQFRTGILPHISLNAINYFAFNLPTTEFLDELYGEFQESARGKNSSLSEKQIIEELNQCGITKSKQWQRNTGNLTSYPVQICVYIRNYIHHPENTCNDEYTETELGDAIRDLISAIKCAKKKLQSQSTSTTPPSS